MLQLKQIKNKYWKQATETKTEEQVIFDFSLARITFLNTAEKQRLFEKVKSAEVLSQLTLNEISQMIFRSLTDKVQWNGKENFEAAKKELEVCGRMNICFIKYTDPQYPVLLKTISNPPYLLFYRGDLKAFENRSVSVVGTRQITLKGKKAAHDFAYQAAQNGVTVISGLAKGVDAFAHKGACDAYFDAFEKNQETDILGKTVAVLPGSIDEIIPSSHKVLAQNIIKCGGCIISEYAPMIGLASWHFVKRNRLIAALSPATVVIEAPDASGALITADFALEMGRDLLFHECCFSQEAAQVNRKVQKELLEQFNEGKISSSKLEVSSSKYVSEGAPVIKDYEDFCKALVEAPGIRQNKIVQPELNFDPD